MKRYSKVLVYLLMVLPTLLMQSCLKDQEDFFDDSAANRMQQYLDETQKILASSEQGWLVEYYPHRNLRYGGYVFIMQFDEAQVKVRSEFSGDASLCETSYYKMTSDNGPVISFDTYNKLLHVFATPNGQMYQGYDGDFEFVIDSYNDNEVVLHGKRTHNVIHMYRLNEDGEKYLEKVIAKSTELKYAGAKGQIGSSENVVGLVDTDSKELELSDGSNIVKTSFCYTDTGISLYQPVTMGGMTFSSLDYDPATEMYTSTGHDGQTISLKAGYPDGWKSYYDLVGQYTVRGTAVKVNVVADEENKTFILRNLSESGDVKAEYNEKFGSINISVQEVWSGKWSDGTPGCLWLCAYNDDYVTWSTDILFKGRNIVSGDKYNIQLRNGEYLSFALFQFEGATPTGDGLAGTEYKFPDPFVLVRN